MSENTPPSPPEPDPWAEATDDVRRAKEAAREAHDKARAEKDQARADKDNARAEKDKARAEKEKARAEKEARRRDEPWAEFGSLKDLDSIKEAVRSASEEVLAAMGHGRPARDTSDTPAPARDADSSARDSSDSSTQAGTGSEATSRSDTADTPGSQAQGAGSAAAGSEPSGDPVRDILADVAAGRIAPDQAAVLIDKARSGGASTSAGGAGGAGGDTKPMTTASETSAEGAEAQTAPVPATTNRLRVRAVGRRVRIIGEPFVSTVAVDGPHVVRQEGDTIVVTSEGEFGASIDGFTLMRSRSLRDVQERVFDIGRELSVRVNPSLTVEVEVTAGSVTAERLPGLEQVRVTAGSARLRDVDGPIDMLVQAGSAQVEGKITRGRSRLRAESGSLQLRLLPGSSVRIRPDVQLGRVQWEPPGKDREEHIVGLGDGILNLEVVMGTATVKEAP